ncbi:hypothetical protein ABZ816_08960 [Actinosynnema sp. NPDC047251]|uniref:hypothetical protein n=1 Tax=Saccharothrix espanaensis TaxID=103731 RepID=UPI0003197469|nr:hypothetical protein [Saccharothrix espanaensis]
MDDLSPEALDKRLRSTFGDLPDPMGVLGGIRDVAVGALTINPSLLPTVCASVVSAYPVSRPAASPTLRERAVARAL